MEANARLKNILRMPTVTVGTGTYVRKYGGKSKMLSEHFSRAEFACHHCGELPEQGISQALLEGLEKLRAAIGNKPINVTNAYRCQHHNHEIGGVRDSQHVLGKAADIWVEGYSAYYLGSVCREIFDGVGIYIDDDFVHVDMRDDGKSVGKYTWYE